MAHFAKIENGMVTFVTPVNDEALSNLQDDESGNKMLNDSGLSGVWIRCSYNTYGGIHLNGGTPFRKNFPGPGYTYDEQRDAFIPPKPFPSWILNEDSCLWEAPVPKPAEIPGLFWDEETLSWQGGFNEPVQ